MSAQEIVVTWVHTRLLNEVHINPTEEKQILITQSRVSSIPISVFNPVPMTIPRHFPAAMLVP